MGLVHGDDPERCCGEGGGRGVHVWERMKELKILKLKKKKKIRDTKGTFHAKMASLKDRNDMDLAEAEDIKKRWQKYTEELYKKIFTTQIITMV